MLRKGVIVVVIARMVRKFANIEIFRINRWAGHGKVPPFVRMG